jgi:catechol 2,3-dioxygenase-like lactoylglutathione lyase family enzyme
VAQIDLRIIEMKEAAERELLARDGVTGVDVGFKYVAGSRTDTIAIRVFVRTKRDVPEADLIPRSIDGFPTDVIERTFELLVEAKPAETTESRAAGAAVDSKTYNPIVGGISIGPCRSINGHTHSGTLGAVVADAESGKLLALSNFHVMCVDTDWNKGDAIAQPSRGDGGVCPSSVIGSILRASVGGEVDCAVAALSRARPSAQQIVDVGYVRGSADASLGGAVRKRGRTTGLTYGSVDGIAQTLKLNYGDGIGWRTLTHQIGIAPDGEMNQAFSVKGDSGSVVVNEKNAVIGLLFAGGAADGSSSANPIASVTAALSIVVKVGSPGTALGGSALTSYTDGGGSHFISLGVRGNVIEIYTAGGKWRWNNITTASGAPSAAPGSALTSYTDGGGSHVICLDPSGNVIEIYYAGGKWQHNNLTAAASGVPSAVPGSALTSYTDGSGSHVICLDPSGNVIEIYYAGRPWQWNNITTTSSAPSAAPGSALTSYTDGGGSHVICLDPSGNVIEIYYAGGKWQHNNLTAAASGVPSAVPGSALTSYTDGSGSHVICLDPSGNVIEIYYAGRPWQWNNITTTSSAPSAAPGSALTSYTDGSGSHVICLDPRAIMIEIYYAGGKWQHNNLTAAASGVPSAVPGGALTSYTDGGGSHVIYLDWRGDPIEIYYADDRWSFHDLTATP